jgi:hypothetical protein
MQPWFDFACHAEAVKAIKGNTVPMITFLIAGNVLWSTDHFQMIVANRPGGPFKPAFGLSGVVSAASANT